MRHLFSLTTLSLAAALALTGCDRNHDHSHGDDGDTHVSASGDDGHPQNNEPQESNNVHAGNSSQPATTDPEYRGLLGDDNPKIVRENDKVLVWAKGESPDDPDSKYYDFTDAPFPPEELQFGIGMDRIPAIDEPVYVDPDDPRLLDKRFIPNSRFRDDEKADKIDDIMVIGYVHNDEARAYPTALLDRHELVNDRIGGKPVTVGW